MMIKINRLTRGDVLNILPNIRSADISECELTSGRSIDEILEHADSTTESYAASINRRVIALFGVNIYQGRALAWMIGTDELTAKKHWMSVVRISKRYIQYFIHKYGILTNYVCMQNKKAVRFLQCMNARFGDVEYNIKENKFKQFWLGERYVQYDGGIAGINSGFGSGKCG